MVDQPTRWTNQKTSSHLSNFIEQTILPKQVTSSKLKQKYLESNLSASQIADELGVSKQMVLARLRSEGIHRGQKGRTAENYRLPNPPYGFSVANSKLVSRPREMRIARIVVELRDRKKKTWVEIAKALNAKSYRTRTGAGWTQSTVRPVHKRWTGKL